jgi:lactosylceramide 4-alpha-galactosyltransferase
MVMMGVWWGALFVVDMASKRLLVDCTEESIVHVGILTGFLSFEWVELTALQHVMASVATVVIAKFSSQQMLPQAVNWKKIIVASFYHLLGTLAINATYVMVETDVAVLLAACQPLFTFILMTRSVSCVDLSNYLTLLFIAMGVFIFQVDTTLLAFNIWGLVVATISSLAISYRNVLLKEGSKKSESTLEKFMIVSALSAILSLPLFFLKILVYGPTHRLLGSAGVFASTISPVYSLASFKILETVTPVTHAIMTTFIKMLSSPETFAYFKWYNRSMNVYVSLPLIMLGLCLYCHHNQHSSARCVSLKLLSLLAVIAYLPAFDPSFSLGMREADKIMASSVSFASMGALRQQDLKKSVSTAWLYDSPIREDVITNIGQLADKNPHLKVYVYCGTTQCVHEVAALDRENVVAGFAVISDIVRGTPLERWVANHPINKLLAGPEFETHLHEVAILGILWQYGGFYVNPTVRLSGSLPEYDNRTTAVVSKVRESTSLPPVFDVSYFSKHHDIINQFAEEYASKYPAANETFVFSFMDTVWEAACSQLQCFDELFVGGLEYASVTLDASQYGVLVDSSCNANIGNEMETFAGIQYLPYINHFIERSDLRSFHTGHNVTTFLNGYWGVSEGSEPPLSSLNPIMLSFQFESGVRRNWNAHLDYLRAHEPIGCHDTVTSDYLRTEGVEHFSSSLILLLKNLKPDSLERRHVYLLGLADANMELLPRKIKERAMILTHTPEMQNDGSKAQSKVAYQWIEKVKLAKLVITDDFQSALACVALETPVVYINVISPVPVAMAPLVHMVDMNRATPHQAKKWFRKLSVNISLQNPNPGLLMRLRATMWKVLREDQHIYDTAIRFGVIPMSPPLSMPRKTGLVFYLVFSTSEDNIMSMGQSGQFNWRHWRCVESIFHHHPAAEVKVYSNTLPENTFDVLTEAGYSIQVVRYYLEILLVGTPAEGFIKKLRKARNGPYWYSNVSNLLRMVLLYQYGGIYMDVDIVVVKSVHTLKANTLGWEAADKGRINGAFAKFNKGNLFLEACLKEFIRNYHGHLWGYNGPALLTRVYHRSKWSDDVLNVVDNKLFYMIGSDDLTQQCFLDTDGEVFDSHMETLATVAYAVHMNSRRTGNRGIAGDHLKKGTICKMLLNSYCVLCDQVH